MKCAHLKYYVNTVTTSREILFYIPLAHKLVLENLTFNMELIFFSVQPEMLLSAILISGGHLGGHLNAYFTLKLLVNFDKNRKNESFQSKIDARVSSGCSGKSYILKKVPKRRNT